MTVSVSELRVAVLPHHAVSGINKISEAQSVLEVMDLEQALRTLHQSDAHFVTYQMAGEKAWPRLNKPVLAELKALGAAVTSSLLVFDFDNKDHQPWTRETFESFQISLDHILAQEELLGSYYAYYTTRSGARLIYVLEEPVDVLQQEEMLCGMKQLFDAKGLNADPLYDWTRLFRLPWVTRDGKETWQKDAYPFGLLDLGRTAFRPLPLDRVPQVPLGRQAVQVKDSARVDPQLPNLDRVDSIIWANASENIHTAWWNQAKVRLQGRDYWEAIFREHALAEKGDRSNAIFRIAGSCVTMLLTLPDTTAEHVFALLLGPVQRMEPDPTNRESWEDMLWRAVRTAWERESSKDSTVVYAAGLTEIKANDLVQGIIEGTRRWCSATEGLTNDDVWKLFENKLILVANNTYYVMKPNGFYDNAAVSKTQLVPQIKKLGMEPLIVTQFVNDKNKLQQVSIENLARCYGLPVFDCLGSLKHDQGSWVQDFLEDKPSVCEPMYSLNHRIVPEYNKYVDTWLRHFAGTNYEILVNWIGHALDFAKPIAALFIEGPPSIGKKMLALGLAENLKNPTLAGSEELVSRFKSQILTTPFIFCNEGFPQISRTSGMKRPADVFREMIDGSPVYVDRKFEKSILVRAPYRLLITANNSDGLRALYGNQDLTPEDREALNVRLVHIKGNPEAAIWLRKMGGLSFTGKDGERWVSGDAGESSNYILARHFRYLHANRKAPPPGHRFLVEGAHNSIFVEEMSLNSGSAPAVLEVVFSMLEQITTPKGLAQKDGQIFVTAVGILDHCKSMQHPARNQLNARNITSVLRGIAKETRARGLDGPEQKRWWMLDTDLLKREAEQAGMVLKKLNEAATPK